MPRFLALLLIVFCAAPLWALDDTHRSQSEQSAQKAIAFLRTQQKADGSWSAEAGPAVTAMVVSAMLRHGVAHTDSAVDKGLSFLLSKQKEDGGIYDSILANYNTSISLMALGPVRDKDPKYAAAVKKAQQFVLGLQWTADKTDPTGKRITEDHPWHGGVGYGKHGRPDNSNLAMWAIGLKDSGYNCDSASYQRILMFVSRLQGSKQNTENADRIEPGGGAIYATSVDKDHIGVPQSQAGEFTDALGKSRLRTYGSMTYAMFMSYLYTELDHDDPRVSDAAGWIGRTTRWIRIPACWMWPTLKKTSDSRAITTTCTCFHAVCAHGPTSRIAPPPNAARPRSRSKTERPLTGPMIWWPNWPACRNPTDHG